MTRIVANEGEQLGEDYRGWPIRQRLELLAFGARLGGVPQALLEALWEAIVLLPYAEMPLTESSGGVTAVAMARLRLAMTLKHD
jgi:hypothetical protein